MFFYVNQPVSYTIVLHKGYSTRCCLRTRYMVVPQLVPESCKIRKKSNKRKCSISAVARTTRDVRHTQRKNDFGKTQVRIFPYTNRMTAVVVVVVLTVSPSCRERQLGKKLVGRVGSRQEVFEI